METWERHVHAGIMIDAVVTWYAKNREEQISWWLIAGLLPNSSFGFIRCKIKHIYFPLQLFQHNT